MSLRKFNLKLHLARIEDSVYKEFYMKLKDLQSVIHSDLFIIDLDKNETYKFVFVYSSTFHKFRNYKVAGVRSRSMGSSDGLKFIDSYLEIAVTNKKR